MTTITVEQEAELRSLLERQRQLAGERNQLSNLSSSLRSAKQAVDIAAMQAEGNVGRVVLDQMSDDLQNITDNASAYAQRVYAESNEVGGRIDSFNVKGHQPVVDSMPVWSLHGTRMSRCLVCGSDVTLTGKYDFARDRQGLRHYTARSYR